MDKGYKVKWSNFHVTVNLNVDGEGHIDAMREAVEEMVYSPWLWMWLKRFDGTSQQVFKGSEKLDVERVRVRASFEHGGEQNHGLHVHLVIEIAHRTMVQIDKYGIDAVFAHFTGMRPNTHVRFLKGEGEDLNFILHYVTKEVSSYCVVHHGRSGSSSLSGSKESSSGSEQFSFVLSIDARRGLSSGEEFESCVKSVWGNEIIKNTACLLMS